MKKIDLNRGYQALVDDEDYELLSQWNWTAHIARQGRVVYAVRYLRKPHRHSIGMHRFIMNAPKGMEVDHINGNSLDNRRSNLRICSRIQNSWNMKLSKSNTSGFRGVYKYRNGKSWIANIGVKGRSIYLGIYKTPVEAAIAYNKKAKEVFGCYARLNSIEPCHE